MSFCSFGDSCLLSSCLGLPPSVATEQMWKEGGRTLGVGREESLLSCPESLRGPRSFVGGVSGSLERAVPALGQLGLGLHHGTPGNVGELEWGWDWGGQQQTPITVSPTCPHAPAPAEHAHLPAISHRGPPK